MSHFNTSRKCPCRRKQMKALQGGGGTTDQEPWSGNPSLPDVNMVNVQPFPPVPRTASGGRTSRWLLFSRSPYKPGERATSRFNSIKRSTNNASFDLTGSRYIPGIENDEQGYEYLGVCENYTSLTLNDTFWATRPENWDVTSLEITAESLSREPGDSLAVWSVNGTEIDHSRWNGTEWMNGTGTSVTNINWIESAYKPGYVEQIILMLDSSGSLKARNWNGSGWPGNIDTLTSSASDPDVLCFDVIYQESSLEPLAIYSNNSDKLLFKEYDGITWKEVANYSLENASWIKAIGMCAPYYPHIYE